MTYLESGLQFTFDKNWRIKKYDEHRFYRALSGVGFKGVDFIGILNNNTLVLIEVKNYKLRFPDKPPPIQAKVLATNPLLVDTMAYKVEDTFSVVNTIIKYYQRRWWYSSSLKLFQILPLPYLLRFEWAYWTHVQRLILEQKEQVNLVLWLEMETAYEGISAAEIQAGRERIEHLLKAEFPDYTFRLCHLGKNEYEKMGLEVQPV